MQQYLSSGLQRQLCDERSSDSDDGDDVVDQGHGWKGPGPLVSSSARQAALQQLKAHQNTWKWSRG